MDLKQINQLHKFVKGCPDFSRFPDDWLSLAISRLQPKQENTSPTLEQLYEII